MKHTFLLVATAMAFATTASFAQKETSPYTATYSSDFKMGNHAYAKMILDLWKDWDDNEMERHDYMADTILMLFADGGSARGKKEALEGAKKYRAAMSSAKSVIHAWVPLYSNNKAEQVVCIWGRETDTYPDGKVVVKDLHEVWWFNKDGKISRMRQWEAKFANP